MEKGVLIHIDDTPERLEESSNYFDQIPLKELFELKTYSKREVFESEIPELSKNIKAIIFDLWGESTRIGEGTAKFLDIIRTTYTNYNIPIFIYTGHPDKVPSEFINRGTVFVIDKDQGVDIIYSKITVLNDSGFLELFSPGGDLDKEIHKDLNYSFVEQFRGNEIEQIINMVHNDDPGELKTICTQIFKRIAVRSLLSKLLAPSDITVNSTEFYYRRITDIKYWTGDILKHNAGNKYSILLTPRCDCSQAVKYILCDIIEDFPMDTGSNNKKDKIKDYLNNNIKERQFRYIPPSPLFIGGKVDFSTYHTQTQEELDREYAVIVTLSDDLTNDILAKFGTYFLRIGINPINYDDLFEYLDSLNEPSK